MSHGRIFALLGILLIGIGIADQGWALVAVWLGCDFIALAVAHGTGNHRVFGKRADGTLPFWSWLLFLPLLLVTTLTWHLLRSFSTEPPYSAINEQIVVGRRLLPSELKEAFENYVDLTSEFTEPADLRKSAAYLSFPILDASAPSPKALLAFVEKLKPGRTFIHCAQGHGRTGLVALSVLLKTGDAQNIEEGLRMLQAVRPGDPTQR